MNKCKQMTQTSDRCDAYVFIDMTGEKVCVHGHRPIGFIPNSMDFLERDHSNMTHVLDKGYFENMWRPKTSRHKLSFETDNGIFLWPFYILEELFDGLNNQPLKEISAKEWKILRGQFEIHDRAKYWKPTTRQDNYLIYLSINHLKTFFDENSEFITAEEIYKESLITSYQKNRMSKYVFKKLLKDRHVRSEDYYRPTPSATRVGRKWFTDYVFLRALKIYIISFAKNYELIDLPEDLVSLSEVIKKYELPTNYVYNVAGARRINVYFKPAKNDQNTNMNSSVRYVSENEFVQYVATTPTGKKYGVAV